MHMSLQQHLDLLMDWNRGSSLQEVIRETVSPGMRVLDAGTGSGVLALWAAQQGADVIAVDRVEYPVAVEMARRNGLADRLRFHPCDLEELDAGALGGRVDVILAMIYWNDPRRDERQSNLARKLIERCLTPGGRAIPDAVEYSVVGHQWPAQEFGLHLKEQRARQLELEARYGLDFTPFFDRLLSQPSAAWFPRRLSDRTLDRTGVRQLTDSISFVVDYSQPVSYPQSLRLPVTREGRATAVIWSQRIRAGARTLFVNESLSWLSPAVDLVPGGSLALDLTGAWRQSNVFATGGCGESWTGRSRGQRLRRS